jgi:hypothetical protein
MKLRATQALVHFFAPHFFAYSFFESISACKKREKGKKGWQKMGGRKMGELSTFLSYNSSVSHRGGYPE